MLWQINVEWDCNILKQMDCDCLYAEWSRVGFDVRKLLFCCCRPGTSSLAKIYDARLAWWEKQQHMNLFRLGPLFWRSHTMEIRSWFPGATDPESWKDIKTMSIDSIKQDQHDLDFTEFLIVFTQSHWILRWLVSSRARWLPWWLPWWNHGYHGFTVRLWKQSMCRRRRTPFWTQQSCSWVDHPKTQELNGFFPGIHRMSCDHMMFGSRPPFSWKYVKLGFGKCSDPIIEQFPLVGDILYILTSTVTYFMPET